MNKIKKYIGAGMLGVLILSGSCTKDFQEINTNPNTVLAATPEALLGPALHDIVSRNQDRAMRIGNELMQYHVTTSDSREFHRYFIRPSEPDYMWRNWYLQLTNIRDIYTNAENTRQPGYKTFKGISLVLDVWVSSMLTDMFGDVPYFEAAKGKEKIIQPKFDTQQAIYEDLFKKLEEANVLFKEDQASLPAGRISMIPDAIRTLDPLFSGETLKWRKFGNSLYLRLLMRVSGKSVTNAPAKIAEIAVTNKANYPIMAGNEDSAILRFTTALPYVSAFNGDRDFDFNGDKGYTEFFINNLNAWDDPRLPKWSTQASGVYAGIPSGYRAGQVPERQSTLLPALKDEPLLGNIMNYGELQFILAEAALKGYITGSPEDFYNNGITAAITFWIPDYANIATHLQKEEIKWNASGTFDQQMEQIFLQKYYTLFFTDFQAWHEYRRTRHPVLPVGQGLLNDGKMPSRFTYPVNVQSLNAANYREAVNRMGGDDLNVKVWWNTAD
mgnify:CR=1 FL=1